MSILGLAVLCTGRVKIFAGMVLAGLLLGACSTTPADLEAKAEPTVQNYSENYQEIYRRVSTTAKRCIAGNISAYASMAVDADLYSELGYGDITMSLINWSVRNYYWSTKIEKAGGGSRLTVRAGNTLAAETAKQSVIRWANGDTTC
jgi:hypothetical protein